MQQANSAAIAQARAKPGRIATLILPRETSWGLFGDRRGAHAAPVFQPKPPDCERVKPSHWATPARSTEETITSGCLSSTRKIFRRNRSRWCAGAHRVLVPFLFQRPPRFWRHPRRSPLHTRSGAFAMKPFCLSLDDAAHAGLRHRAGLKCFVRPGIPLAGLSPVPSRGRSSFLTQRSGA